MTLRDRSSFHRSWARVAGTLAPGLALGVAGVLLLPATETLGFSKFGQGSGPVLSVNQRDFRVFNNFSDAETNNNTTPDSQFPGWDGAEMAIWKASIEWGSGSHGNGSGDPARAQSWPVQAWLPRGCVSCDQ